MAAGTKKPGFPSKTCPKCGELIHARSQSHDKCGWEMKKTPKASAKKSGKKRSRPKGKPTESFIRLEGITKLKEAVDSLGGKENARKILEIL